jgi:hypothetical protein
MSPPASTLLLGVVTLLVASQPRLTERTLADIARVGVPSALKGPDNPVPRQAVMARLSWSFSSTYLWASMGSVTRYKQKMIVAVMAPDATAAEYEELPHGMDVIYEPRKRIRHDALGSGTLTVWAGDYALGVNREPSYLYFYADRARRLQIVWHAVAKELDLATGVAQIPRIAASFRIVRDPRAMFAEMRDAPRKEAESRAGKVATAREMLRREGYPALEPGKPVLRNGVYLEWMADPEPRYQLLVPLGKVLAAANGSVVNRPRPIRVDNTTGMAGTIGWREFTDGEWVFSNGVNDYLPLEGIGASLAGNQQDRNFVYFYYAATVRVEEQDDDRFLTSLKWFLDGVPDVQRRWREGKLVAPGKPELP